jgi:glycosyltransferase involved in cell wall biosynthesis
VSTATPALDRVAVIIPALNEAQSLPLVLGDLPSVGWVIVVDNGSTDDTAAVAARCGSLVVTESQRGYGAACLRGLAAVAELAAQDRGEPVVIAFLDADYSDHPEFLPQLVAPILEGRMDFVLGSRLQGRRDPGAMPPQSIWGNRLACFLMRALCRASYTDLGPFRAIRYDRLRALGMVDRNFGWTIEMQLKAVRAGLRIQEIPVPYRRRIGRSKISGTLGGTLRAGTKILYTIGKYGLRRGSP